MSQFWLHAARLGTSTAVGQAVFLGALPLVTQLYSAEEVGAWSVYASVAAIGSAIGVLRLDQAIYLAEDASEVRTIAHTVAIATLIVGVGLGLCSALLMVAGVLRSAYALSALLPIAVVASGAYSVSMSAAMRAGARPVVNRSRVAQPITFAAVAVGGGLLHLGLAGLLIADFFNRAAGSVDQARAAGWRRAKCRPERRRFATRLLHGRAVLVRYRDLVVHGTFGLVLGLLSQSVLVFAFPALVSLSAAGNVALATRALVLPSTFVSQAIATTLVEKLSRSVRAQQVNAEKGEVRRVVLVLTLVAAGLFGGVVVLAPTISRQVLGAEFSAAGDFAALLSAGAAGTFVVGAVSPVYVVARRQGLALTFTVLDLGLKCGIVLLLGNRASVTVVLAVVSVSSAVVSVAAIAVIVRLVGATAAEAGRDSLRLLSVLGILSLGGIVVQ